MKNKKRNVNIIGILLIIAGAALVAAAAFIFMHYHTSHKKMSEVRAAVTEKMEDILSEREAGIIDKEDERDMPVIEIDGNDYIGILEIDELDIKLSVGAVWEGADTYRPARYSGNIYNGTLVIGGTDDNDCFGFAGSLETGERVVFTDVTGTSFEFNVTKITHADDINEDTLISQDDALVLFVKSGGKFLIVHCTV